MRADPMRAFLRLRAAVGIARLTSAPHQRASSISTTTHALPPWPPGDADADDADSALVRASSLPPPYYAHPSAAALDQSRVFQPAWLYAGPASWVEKPGDYFTIGGGGGGAVPRAVVARGPDSELRAFSNVCRHRAAPVATRLRGNRLREQENDGCDMAFVCGYHGWTYRHDGKLTLAPKMGGVERLSARRLSLAPLDVEVVGPLVFVRRRRRREDDDEDDSDSSLDAWLGPEGAAAVRAVVRGDYSRDADFEAAESAQASSSSSSSSSPRLLHVARRQWLLQCDWKVFADNFLDGGYHVSCAHPQLAEGLDLRTYSSRLHGPRVSVQSVAAVAASGTEDDDGDSAATRLGSRAAYAWLFPNVALNRYGRWLDVNAVVPEGPGKCRVTFDWFLEEEEEQGGDAQAAAAVADALSLSSSPQAPPSWDEQLRLLPTSVADALRSSCGVQEEDVALCEGVQAGLEEAAAVGGVYGSPALVGSSTIGGGRYARQEAPMFHFHRALWAAYNSARDE